ncbi:MAG: cell division protein CrgA [Acidobacteria bacterium]|nr:cell division protein CrgA [Acidobacteriota bacterium]NDC48160.1 cell division protein CrgA [Micrococcales bacterium]
MSETEKKSFKLPKRPKKPAVPDSVKAQKAKSGNPVWFVPVAVGLMIAGLIWIMVYYISQTLFPLGAGTPFDIGASNIIVGFGMMMVGFFMLTRWK